MCLDELFYVLKVGLVSVLGAASDHHQDALSVETITPTELMTLN